MSKNVDRFQEARDRLSVAAYQVENLIRAIREAREDMEGVVEQCRRFTAKHQH